jgi:hypothetical protein
MKKLLLTFTLLFSTLMFSTPSYGEWTKVSESVDGRNFYMDIERIRKHSGYVYYWELTDFLKPMENGIFSGKTYNQGDCKVFRFKRLSYSFHKEPMGGGTGDVQEPQNKGWHYPSPETSQETILKRVCSQ